MNKIKKSSFIKIISFAVIMLLFILLIVFMPFIELTSFNVSKVNYKQNQIKVMSYNIKTENDAGKEYYKEWRYRKNILTLKIQREAPDILGIQEATVNQYNFLKQYLKGYESVVLFRDKNGTSGESTPIFYRKDRFKIISQECFWLSETPETCSIGWDASYSRVAVSVVLKEINANKTFQVVNTHLDNIGSIERREGTKLILSKINDLDNCIIMGDMNCLETGDAYKIFITNNLLDARKVAEKSTNEITFHGYDETPYPRTLDYIFLSHSFDVEEFKVLKKREEEICVSDHYAIVANINI